MSVENGIENFDEWMKKNVIPSSDSKVTTTLRNVCKQSGISLNSIFEETNPIRLREICSKLLRDRSKLNEVDEKEFISVAILLVSYSEYLAISERKYIDEQKNEKLYDSLTVAYYLSRVDKMALEILGYGNYKKTFDSLSEILSIKSSTLKNYRDEFDPYFDNGRVGWYQRELRGSRKIIFERYQDKSDEYLTDLVLKIIKKYSEYKTIDNKKEHKKLKISTGSMKEIKSKKK